MKTHEDFKVIDSLLDLIVRQMDLIDARIPELSGSQQDLRSYFIGQEQALYMVKSLALALKEKGTENDEKTN